MLALANCKAALIGLLSSTADTQAQDLQRLIQLTENTLHQRLPPIAFTNESSEDTPLPRVQPVVPPPPPVPWLTSALLLPHNLH